MSGGSTGTERRGFSVQPRLNCPHVVAVAAGLDEIPAMPAYPNTCEDCGDTSGENWVCVTCRHVACSRYVHGDAAAHHAACGHPVAVSYADCSAWCYLCEDYIGGITVNPFVVAVQHQKFGVSAAPAPEAAPPPPPQRAPQQAAAVAPANVTRLAESASAVEINATAPTDVLLVEGCHSSTVTISGSEMDRIAFSQCRSIRLDCGARLISGMLGVKASKKLHIIMRRPVGHVFVEDCEDVTLALYGEGLAPWDVVHTIRSVGVSILLASGERYRIRSSRTKSIATQIVRRAIVSEYVDGGSAEGGQEEGAEERPGEMDVAVPVASHKRGREKPEDIVELFDEPEVLEEKIRKLAALLRTPDGKWERIVVYTGAGVSTSAQIPDYRGPKGAWTLADKGERCEIKVKFEDAMPTVAHMAIMELARVGAVQLVASTNVDGLHLRSGMPADKLAELHGNAFLEVCRKCESRWFRTFDTTSVKGDRMVDDVHSTGRSCEKCGEPLYDSIVHFGEGLPASELERALKESKKSTVSLVLGTSMMVFPACELPLNARKLVIVNLQKTQYDDDAALRIFARIDVVMERLMAILGIPIPEYVPATTTTAAPSAP